MSESYIGEIKLFGFQFAPRGWALCQGQLLSISQNQALFSILGTTYGGDGVTTFALPDLRGRAPVHTGNGVQLGAAGGEEAHTLTAQEMPVHSHTVSAGGNPATEYTPVGQAWTPAANGAAVFSAGANTAMNANALSAAGASQAHGNMQPYLAMNYCICLMGVFPSRN
ncbi:tail fiber protein [Paenibacillus sp. N4]|uniref:phage tail protein n=1 Tax=Paenibacillus vietnamensis TaxID=2590547 RepID=UPI001CD17A37|nr:tail fiber protein [Paenibacillus vietnamensis]MCA0757333.1 tail fiber protein [Paenibacillus vietnamensis]